LLATLGSIIQTPIVPKRINLCWCWVYICCIFSARYS